MNPTKNLKCIPQVRWITSITLIYQIQHKKHRSNSGNKILNLSFLHIATLIYSVISLNQVLSKSKFIFRYVGAFSKSTEDCPEICNRILEIQFILETFG
jgi:hypothetical protein